VAESSEQVKLLVTFLPPSNHLDLIAVSVPVTEWSLGAADVPPWELAIKDSLCNSSA
jgi:hypothetical protein